MARSGFPAAIAFMALACSSAGGPVPVVQPSLEPPSGGTSAPANPRTPPLATVPPPAPTPSPSRSPAPLSAAHDAGRAVIRVALVLSASGTRIASAQPWELYGANGAGVLVR